MMEGEMHFFGFMRLVSRIGRSRRRLRKWLGASMRSGPTLIPYLVELRSALSGD